MATTQQVGVSTLRKLTLRACGLDKATIVEKVMADREKIIPLIRVWGVAGSARPGTSSNGDYLRLGGEFRAVNLLTGEMFQSGSCILPNFVSEGLGGLIGAGGSAEFGIEIGAKYDEKAATLYTYEARAVVESKPSERMQSLSLQMAQGLPQLAAPDAGDEATPAKGGKGRK